MSPRSFGSVFSLVRSLRQSRGTAFGSRSLARCRAATRSSRRLAAAGPTRAGVECLERRALLATTATVSMPVLSPDLVAPSAAVADTIASPAVTVASLSAPGSPTGLVAVPGNARVSLTWSAPLSNGGARISDYVVQYSSDTGTTWTTFADRVSAATSATVTGLTNGASYLFRVAAVNAAGTGDPSARSASFVPATFGGFSELSAPEQMATGTAVPISGRVFDPTGTAVDAIHVYRDADGNGDLDPGIDQLLHVDTTPGSGFEFDTSTLASGVHRIIVAATNAGSVVGSTPLTVTASDWWEMSIGAGRSGSATTTGSTHTRTPSGRARFGWGCGGPWRQRSRTTPVQQTRSTSTCRMTPS